MVGTATLTMVWSSAASRIVIITAAVAARNWPGVSSGAGVGAGGCEGAGEGRVG